LAFYGNYVRQVSLSLKIFGGIKAEIPSEKMAENSSQRQKNSQRRSRNYKKLLNVTINSAAQSLIQKI